MSDMRERTDAAAGAIIAASAAAGGSDTNERPVISVIVPALNEATYLPRLLDSLSAQRGVPFEVIVADAGSTDGTREAAEKWGAIVVPGGKPAEGRNAGAAVARGDFLFFLDADIRLPEGFLKSAYDEMERRYIDLATCEGRPDSDISFDKLLFSFSTTVMRLTLRMEPRAQGYATFVTKRLFRRAGGFDESVTLGEDHDFSKRAARIRPLEFLTSVYVVVSVRRLEKEGRVAYLVKAIHSDLHRRLIGEIRNDLIEYEFGHYEPESGAADDTLEVAVDREEVDAESPAESEPDDTAPAASGTGKSAFERLDRWLLQMDQTIRWVAQRSKERALPDRDETVRQLSVEAQQQFRLIGERLRRSARRRKRRAERKEARAAGERRGFQKPAGRKQSTGKPSRGKPSRSPPANRKPRGQNPAGRRSRRQTEDDS